MSAIRYRTGKRVRGTECDALAMVLRCVLKPSLPISPVANSALKNVTAWLPAADKLGRSSH